MALATSHVNAPRLTATAVPLVLVSAVARSATSAVVLDTLRAAAPRAAVATEVDSAVASVVASRPATLAVVSVTWLVTAPRARSATTVSRVTIHLSHASPAKLTFLGGELGHVSRDCPTEAKGERVCYKCKESGHVQAACPN